MSCLPAAPARRDRGRRPPARRGRRGRRRARPRDDARRDEGLSHRRPGGGARQPARRRGGRRARVAAAGDDPLRRQRSARAHAHRPRRRRGLPGPRASFCFGLPRARGGGFARGRCRLAFEGGGVRGVRRSSSSKRAGPLRRRRRGSLAAVLGAWAARPSWGRCSSCPRRRRRPTPPPARWPRCATRFASAPERLPAGDLGAATILRGADGGPVLACRYVGASAERGGGFLRGAWAAARRAVLDRDACPPRIWAT